MIDVQDEAEKQFRPFADFGQKTLKIRL